MVKNLREMEKILWLLIWMHWELWILY